MAPITGPGCRVRLFDNSAGSALRDSDCWNWRSMAQGFLLVAAVRRNGRAGGRVSRGAYVRWMCRYRSVWTAAPRRMFAGNRPVRSPEAVHTKRSRPLAAAGPRIGFRQRVPLYDLAWRALPRL